MAKDDLSGKLAVILHADVAGSTQLVQQDEQLAHERIRDAFQRFSDTIRKYHGRVQELRGDALLAEFERASDAVTAALAFQSEHQDHLGRFGLSPAAGVLSVPGGNGKQLRPGVLHGRSRCRCRV